MVVNFKRGEDGDWRRQDRSPTGRRWTETEESEFRRACLPHPSSWRSDLINSRRGISVSLLRLASLVWLSLTVTVSPHRMHISVCMVVDQTWTVKFYPLLRCDCDAIRFHRLRFAWLQKQHTQTWPAGYNRVERICQCNKNNLFCSYSYNLRFPRVHRQIEAYIKSSAYDDSGQDGTSKPIRREVFTTRQRGAAFKVPVIQSFRAGGWLALAVFPARAPRLAIFMRRGCLVS